MALLGGNLLLKLGAFVFERGDFSVIEMRCKLEQKCSVIALLQGFIN